MVMEPMDRLSKWQRIRDMEEARPTFVPCAPTAGAAEGLARPMDPPAGMPASKAAQWADLRGRLHGLPATDMLEPVNEFFNEWPYITDRKLHAVEDHWAAPFEFMAGGGDCEDYAIAKYYALRSLGFTPGELRLAGVWNSRRGEAHAVLLVYINAAPFILDNYSNELRRPAELPHYRMQYYVNEEELWLLRKNP